MESAEAIKISERQKALESWLDACGLHALNLQPMAGDASFRRYFRATTQQGTHVIMDAPPPRENCKPYVAIAEALRKKGLHAPEIIYQNIEQGFLVLTDFGDLTYLKALNDDNADELYLRALKTLAQLQKIKRIPNHMVPPFTAEFMWQEWAWHKEWFLTKLLNLSFAQEEKQLDLCYALLVDSAVSQPQVFMHRDYHSANLMVLPEKNVGVLDFQDAFIGPITYDAVSLLRDCYINWPEEKINYWLNAYWQMLYAQTDKHDITEALFTRWFDFMGMQRHLKALMTFARKKVRDQQPEYLRFIPRTLQYLITVSQRYPELSALHIFLEQQVKPEIERGL